MLIVCVITLLLIVGFFFLYGVGSMISQAVKEKEFAGWAFFAAICFILTMLGTLYLYDILIGFRFY